jgi:hypothetical protein
VVLAVAVMAPMTRTESTGPYSMASGPSSAPTGPLPRGRPRPAHRHRRRLGQAGERGRDGGRIIVTVVSTSRLPVVVQMSRARWPSSPTARSCDCLHRGSNAQSRQQNRRGGALARADGERKLCRAEAGAPLGGFVSWGRRGSGRRARARVHLQHVRRSCAPARSGRADRKLRALHALLPAGPGDTPACEGLMSLGSKRLVTKLIAGWAVLPVL